MNQIFFGGLSAVSLGTADFLAGLTGRAVGHANALLAVYIVSCVGMSVYMLVSGHPMEIDLPAQWLIVLFGLMNTVAMLLLYKALALGPLSVAAPIVAAHPAAVVMFAFALGSRPSAGQWIGMAMAMAGAIIVARASSEEGTEKERRSHGKTILVATAACFAYAVLIISGQHSVPLHGEPQTLWLGRIVALVFLLLFFLISRKAPGLPMKWLPVLCVQGMLDFGGVLFLLFGSNGEFSEITAVISSLFGGVTVLLAWIFLKEKISSIQWAGVAIILSGVGCLTYFA